MDDRGGNGGTYLSAGEWKFPPTDGKGCPLCGAIGEGGHGGGCRNNLLRFDEDGENVTDIVMKVVYEQWRAFPVQRGPLDLRPVSRSSSGITEVCCSFASAVPDTRKPPAHRGEGGFCYG